MIAADVIELAYTGLLDAEWYSAAYSGRLGDGVDALVHFCNGGWVSGLNPSFYFDTNYYLDMYADVRVAKVNPLIHYLRHGDRENREVSLHFDPKWYRRHYAVQQGASCLGDYLESRKGRNPTNPNPAFDIGWYLGSYPDVAEAGHDPFEHYCRWGVREGREPSEEVATIRRSGLFDAEYYLATQPDVRMCGIDPVYHFCAYGWRLAQRRPSRQFDVAWYLGEYEDVRLSGENPLLHYGRVGRSEGRLPCPSPPTPLARKSQKRVIADDPVAQELDWGGRDCLSDIDKIGMSELMDESYYLLHSPDVRISGLQPLDHFCRYGWQEGRRPNPYFDPHWYRSTYMEASDDKNPLIHYITVGQPNRFRPIIYFDPEFYSRQIGEKGCDRLLSHFLRHRRSQRHSPVEAFDVAWYSRAYATDIGPNRDPFAHYLRVGISRDVDPSPTFDAGQYRRASMGVPPQPAPRESGGAAGERLQKELRNPLVHFLTSTFHRHQQ